MIVIAVILKLIKYVFYIEEADISLCMHVVIFCMYCFTIIVFSIYLL